MKSGLFKRILAMTMMTVLLAGDVLPTFAETVSGGDAVVVEGEDAVNNDEQAEDTEDIVNPNPDVTEEDEEETSDELTEETTSVSDGDAEVVEIEEEETPLDAGIENIVLTKEVKGVVITLTAPAGSLPDNAELWAEEIAQTSDNKEQIEVIDQALEAEEEQKEIAVQQYKAFDIKILVGDEVVQPNEEVVVTFEGDILLPAADEELTVYHISDDAVANPVGGLNEENKPEMVTDHFSTYVIVVSGDADADGYTVTVSHYLSEDENKPVEARQKFYNSADFQLDKASMMTVPVQGGEDYTLKKVVLKKTDGSIIKEINNVITSDNQVALEISQDTLVEMYYEPTTNANHLNEVTYFDYSIMSKGIKLVPTEKRYGLNWAQKVSFDYKGQSYNQLVYMSGKFGTINPEASWEIIPQVTPNNGDVFSNIICYSSTGEVAFKWDGNAKFDSGNFVYVEDVKTPYTSVKNAGINSYGEGHEKEFLAMGQTGTFHNYTLNINKNGNTLNANVNNASHGGNVGAAIIPNLITGLSDDLKNVVTGPGVYEPGYFSVAPLEGKTIYSDRFELKFNRNGHKYVLTSSVDNVTGTETMAGKNNADFFPLNEVPYEDTQKAVVASPGGNGESLTKGNCFFGMRYDFTFSIGDYVGPLEYTFVGDDDLWVFLDGHRVLDLGGLHQMYPTAYGTPKENNVVDLWTVTDENGKLLIDSTTEAGKNEVHQVTVLYMERGGWDSTCYMEFVIPNAVPLESVITERPRAELELLKLEKVGKKETPIAQVGFTLSKDKNNIDKGKKLFTDENGKVKFSGLQQGITYYIKETDYDENTYKPNNTIYVVTVTEKDGKAYATMTVDASCKQITKKDGAYIIYNERLPQDGKLKIEKQDSITRDEIKGVEFTLYSDSTCKNKIYTKTTDDDGDVKFKKLTVGTYYLKETKCAEGYKENDTVYTVKVEWNEKKKEVEVRLFEGDKECPFEDDDEDEYLILNTPISTIDLNFIKVDRNNHSHKLSDAEFVLKDENGNQIGKTQTSATNGSFSFEKIEEGTYYLNEIIAPDGYVLPTKEWKIVVGKYEEIAAKKYPSTWIAHKDDDVLAFAVIDGPSGLWKTDDNDASKMLIKNNLSVDFTFTKKDAFTKASLQGVKFTIYKEVWLDENNKITDAYSDSDGKVTFSNLYEGKYLLVETVPNGYEETEPWILEIEYNQTSKQYVTKLYNAILDWGNCYKVADEGQYQSENIVIENTPLLGELKIVKTVDQVDEVHGVAAFTFKIICPDGNVLYRTISFKEGDDLTEGKTVVINNLPLGKYTVEELNALRYKCTPETSVKQEDEIEVGKPAVFTYSNEKVFDYYYSHTDVAVNKVTFVKDENGNITGSEIKTEKSSTSDEN